MQSKPKTNKVKLLLNRSLYSKLHSVFGFYHLDSSLPVDIQAKCLIRVNSVEWRSSLEDRTVSGCTVYAEVNSFSRTFRHKLLRLCTYWIFAKLLVLEMLAGRLARCAEAQLSATWLSFFINPPTVLALLNRNPVQAFAFLCLCEEEGRETREVVSNRAGREGLFCHRDVSLICLIWCFFQLLLLFLSAPEICLWECLTDFKPEVSKWSMN